MDINDFTLALAIPRTLRVRTLRVRVIFSNQVVWVMIGEYMFNLNDINDFTLSYSAPSPSGQHAQVQTYAPSQPEAPGPSGQHIYSHYGAQAQAHAPSYGPGGPSASGTSSLSGVLGPDEHHHGPIPIHP
jgi:hypothetical protein